MNDVSEKLYNLYKSYIKKKEVLNQIRSELQNQINVICNSSDCKSCHIKEICEKLNVD